MFTNYLIYPPAIGQPDGPHSTDCSCCACGWKRHDAERLCHVCHEPIGFGNAVYLEDSHHSIPTHKACLEAEYAEYAPQHGEAWVSAVEQWIAGAISNQDFTQAWRDVAENKANVGSIYLHFTGARVSN